MATVGINTAWAVRLVLLMVGSTLAVTACGGGPTELIVRGAGSDGCEYDGPSRMSSGSVDILVSPSGLGQISAVIHELDPQWSGDEVGADDLGAVVATVSSRESVDFARRSEELEPGRYAVSCDYGDFDGVVATLEVSP